MTTASAAAPPLPSGSKADFFSRIGLYSAEGDRSKLLPDAAYSPWILLALGAVPQLVLLLLNAHSYWLVGGELSWAQNAKWLGFLGLGVVMIIGYAWAALSLSAAGRKMRWLSCLGWTAATAFLFIFFVLQSDWDNPMIPREAARWLLTEEVFTIRQLTFAMPGLLFPVVLLGGYPSGGPAGDSRRDAGWGGLALFAGLGLFAIVYAVVEGGFGSIGLVPFLLAIALTGIFIGAALVRLLLVMLRSTARSGTAPQLAVTAVVCLALPLIGLWVNQEIPFPTHFHGPLPWGLAVLNGLLLLVPAVRSPGIEAALWVARCAMLAFTLYFAAVYVPFLPLAVPALAMWGGGFLLIVPVLVLIVQGARVAAGWRRTQEDFALGTAALASLAVAGLLALPAAFLARCAFDRTVMRGALDHLFTAQSGLAADDQFVAPDIEFDGSRVAVQRALEGLHRVKHGIWMPYLTAAYNRIVFDNLTLPDSKIEFIHQAVLGKPLEVEADRNAWSTRGIFGNTRGNNRSIDNPAVHTECQLADLAIDHSPSEGGTHELTATLTATNRRSNVGEFTTELTLPAGTQVAGFWLEINGDWIPGRLFEQKSALWVYQQIRDRTNADPSVIYYREDGSLNLRIYPVPGNGERRVRLLLRSPEGSAGKAVVGDREFAVGEEDKANAGDYALVASDDRGSSLLLGEKSATALPVGQRTPYLHLILDSSSAGPAWDRAALEAFAARAQEQVPEATHAVISTANFEQRWLVDTPTPIAEAIDSALSSPLPPPRGGLLRTHALVHALAAGVALQEEPGGHLRYPIAFVGKGGSYSDSTGPGAPLDHPDLAPALGALAAIVPDSSIVYSWDKGSGDLVAATMAGHSEVPLAQADGLDEIPVALLQLRPSAPARAAAPTEGAQVVHWYGKDEGQDPELRLWDFEKSEFTDAAPTVTALAPDLGYAAGLAAQREVARGVLSLGRTGTNATAEMLAIARSGGTLVPGTTYMVMESDWQWKAASEAEKKKLKGHSALEMSEAEDEPLNGGSVPEPSTALLLILGAALVALRRQRRG